MTSPRTFSVEEYAAALLGPGPDGTAASVEPFKIQWLTKRLRGQAQPALPGYKAGRRWRATQADLDEAIDRLHPKQVEIPNVPQIGGMTRTSRRRLSA
jgi:hypothetical protein